MLCVFVRSGFACLGVVTPDCVPLVFAWLGRGDPEVVSMGSGSRGSV